jgi:hypothetical protein
MYETFILGFYQYSYNVSPPYIHVSVTSRDEWRQTIFEPALQLMPGGHSPEIWWLDDLNATHGLQTWLLMIAISYSKLWRPPGEVAQLCSETIAERACRGAVDFAGMMTSPTQLHGNLLF